MSGAESSDMPNVMRSNSATVKPSGITRSRSGQRAMSRCFPARHSSPLNMGTGCIVSPFKIDPCCIVLQLQRLGEQPISHHSAPWRFSIAGGKTCSKAFGTAAGSPPCCPHSTGLINSGSDACFRAQSRSLPPGSTSHTGGAGGQVANRSESPFSNKDGNPESRRYLRTATRSFTVRLGSNKKLFSFLCAFRAALRARRNPSSSANCLTMRTSCSCISSRVPYFILSAPNPENTFMLWPTRLA